MQKYNSWAIPKPLLTQDFHFPCPANISLCSNLTDSNPPTSNNSIIEQIVNNRGVTSGEMKRDLGCPGPGKGTAGDGVLGLLAKLWSQKVPSLLLGLVPLKLKFPKKYY